MHKSNLFRCHCSPHGNENEWAIYVQYKLTYLINIQIPVGCIARLIPFHDASIVYFWRALNGNRGSGAAGGGGSLGPNAFVPSDFVLAANFPNLQPIFRFFSLSFYVLETALVPAVQTLNCALSAQYVLCAINFYFQLHSLTHAAVRDCRVFFLCTVLNTNHWSALCAHNRSLWTACYLLFFCNFIPFGWSRTFEVNKRTARGRENNTTVTIRVFNGPECDLCNIN